MKERYIKFTLLINSLYRSIHKIKSAEMEKLGLKSSDVSSLFYLYNFGTLTASELCAMSGEDKAVLSKGLKQLQNLGLIKAEETLPKKYRSKLSLTSEGSAIAEKITDIASKKVELGSHGISPQKREEFYSTLELISNNLENICEEYKND